MILCISPNTNIERTWTVPGLALGGVFRVAEEFAHASGKGINVARAVLRLGGNATGRGFAAGFQGQLFAQMAEIESLPGLWTWVEGEERMALALVDPLSPGDATLISGPGPRVSTKDWLRLQADILSNLAGITRACFSGSLPPGSDLQVFTETIRKLEDSGVQVWIDCSGEALKAALEARPSGVKVNALEISEINQSTVADVPSALQAAQWVASHGIATVILTMGKQGAVAYQPGQAWQVIAPEMTEFRSSVGSGDAFLAGLLVSLEREQDLPEALRHAAAAGAANVLMLGGGRLDFEEYELALPRVVVQPVSLD